MIRHPAPSSFVIASIASLVASSLCTARAQDPCLQSMTPVAPGTNAGWISPGDLDGDGDLDLVLNGSGVHLNAGNGTFTLVPQPVPGPGSLLRDMDGDGDLDVLSYEHSTSKIFVRLYQGAGTLGAAVSYFTGAFPSDLAAGDVDGDGDVDLVTSNEFALSLSVHLNPGNGTIAQYFNIPGGTPDGGGTHNSGVELGDLDGDDDLDLVWALDSANPLNRRFCVRLNLGGGTFGGILTTNVDGDLTSPTLADLNGDGLLDVISTDPQADTTDVYLNAGSGVLSPAVSYATGALGSVVCGDWDGDGDQDMVVLSADPGIAIGLRFMINDGTGSFSVNPSLIFPDSSSHAFVLANIVGDPKPELLTADIGAGVLVYRNCQTVGTRYCFGDGTSAACPCQNPGIADHGCANIAYASGAQLSASGIASVSSDSLKLTSEGMSGAQSWYFQATGQDAIPFGRGILCQSGALLRVGQKAVFAGSSTNPSGVDLPLSVKGAIPPAGGTRYYQVSYRHANPVCTPAPVSNTNRTNGLTITWVP